MKQGKNVRNAVRVFLIEDNHVVAIQYRSNQGGYMDIPGGKIEEGETSMQAAIREYQEEVGMEISNLEFVGKTVIEYPDRIYQFDVYTVGTYTGIPKEFVENTSFWIPIEEILKQEKRYAITHILEEKYREQMKTKSLHVKFTVDENHNILKIDEI